MPQPRPRLWRRVGLPAKGDRGIGVALAVLVLVGSGLAATLQDHARQIDAGAISLVLQRHMLCIGIEPTFPVAAASLGLALPRQ
jgi:hypothetical protein